MQRQRRGPEPGLSGRHNLTRRGRRLRIPVKSSVDLVHHCLGFENIGPEMSLRHSPWSTGVGAGRGAALETGRSRRRTGLEIQFHPQANLDGVPSKFSVECLRVRIFHLLDQHVFAQLSIGWIIHRRLARGVFANPEKLLPLESIHAGVFLQDCHNLAPMFLQFLMVPLRQNDQAVRSPIIFFPSLIFLASEKGETA